MSLTRRELLPSAIGGAAILAMPSLTEARSIIPTVDYTDWEASMLARYETNRTSFEALVSSHVMPPEDRPNVGDHIGTADVGPRSPWQIEIANIFSRNIPGTKTAWSQFGHVYATAALAFWVGDETFDGMPAEHDQHAASAKKVLTTVFKQELQSLAGRGYTTAVWRRWPKFQYKSSEVQFGHGTFQVSMRLHLLTEAQYLDLTV